MIPIRVIRIWMVYFIDLVSSTVTVWLQMKRRLSAVLTSKRCLSMFVYAFLLLLLLLAAVIADVVNQFQCKFSSFSLIVCLGIPYTHIASPMPDIYRTFSSIPRGVANRRAAINWIRQNGKKPAVMYFGDDDNTFDLKLFDEIRYTKRVSMFPVGLIGLYAVSTPVVRNVSRYQ